MTHYFHKGMLLILMLLFLLPSITFASETLEAGRIIVHGANSYAVNEDGVRRELKKDSQVYTGETIITNENPLQIQFTDGGLTTLRPNTEFFIKSYLWEGGANGKEEGFFELIKGGLRTITGAIGKKDRKKYQMMTPVAVIGIRGTDYSIRYCAEDCTEEEKEAAATDGLIGSVHSGRIEVSNEGGKRVFKRKNYFRVASRALRPGRIKSTISRFLRIPGKFRYKPIRSLTRTLKRGAHAVESGIKKLNPNRLF